MRLLAIATLGLGLSGCVLSINPIGMLGIVHHKSHHTSSCVWPHCIDDSGMGPKVK
jgi:hypothetical protein